MEISLDINRAVDDDMPDAGERLFETDKNELIAGGNIYDTGKDVDFCFVE